ncbi:YicC/YloC family endoribonuclease [Peribacillus alkalitolerans]|uniref:YicC/YloC family endoribonuclease n=1 Tax=Peribacillus alkalitolerans TaxID=1550385 RepID=UPI0013D0B9B5|nr:YicC/YloC family endoribonuclease [Peribacillus alkalitolerans]
MVVSMTGYGRGTREQDNVKVIVEVKTVNHRFLECSFRMPRQLLVLEDKLKKTMHTYINRGRAEVYVTVEGEGLINRRLQLDWKLLHQFMEEMEKVNEAFSLNQKPSLKEITAIENIISVEEFQTDNNIIEDLIIESLKDACKTLKVMREEEGAELKKDLHFQMKNIWSSTEKIREFAPNVLASYRERLKQKMVEYANGLIDETRLLNEVAIFADKADINEEITRLQSHVSQFEKTMDDHGPIGRKLDFIVQEMNREVNTIGSKANDASITTFVVEMKSSLEKMKEQVQNIE